MNTDFWDKAERNLDLTIAEKQRQQLDIFGNWLMEEAQAAGGVGPHEDKDKVWNRHLLDSLQFVHGWSDSDFPTEIWDWGSGAGLPGIPLAIVHPHTKIELLDRRDSVLRLARRAVQILELENVGTISGDITKIDQQVPAIVSRGAICPGKLQPHLRRCLGRGGRAVLAGSTKSRPEYEHYQTLVVPAERHALPKWLLIMDNRD